MRQRVSQAITQDFILGLLHTPQSNICLFFCIFFGFYMLTFRSFFALFQGPWLINIWVLRLPFRLPLHCWSLFEKSKSPHRHWLWIIHPMGRDLWPTDESITLSFFCCLVRWSCLLPNLMGFTSIPPLVGFFFLLLSKRNPFKYVLSSFVQQQSVKRHNSSDFLTFIRKRLRLVRLPLI